LGGENPQKLEQGILIVLDVSLEALDVSLDNASILLFQVPNILILTCYILRRMPRNDLCSAFSTS
jgi:hypothetical protein